MTESLEQSLGGGIAALGSGSALGEGLGGELVPRLERVKDGLRMRLIRTGSQAPVLFLFNRSMRALTIMLDGRSNWAVTHSWACPRSTGATTGSKIFGQSETQTRQMP